MWPRDAYVGQRVVCINEGESPQDYNVKLTKGKIYTIASISVHYIDVVYFELVELEGWLVRNNLVRPVDESRLDVFRSMLKNAGNKNVVREDA